MNWLKSLFKKIFQRKKTPLLPEQQVIPAKSTETSDFLLNLKSLADLERDDRNGYRIMPKLKLKDMV